MEVGTCGSDVVRMCRLVLIKSFNRVDKKFYRAAELRKWVVVIYETQQRFNAAAADRLVKDLVRGARARGMDTIYLLVHEMKVFKRLTGMAVLMEQPLIKWCNGQGNIAQVTP